MPWKWKTIREWAWKKATWEKPEFPLCAANGRISALHSEKLRINPLWSLYIQIYALDFWIYQYREKTPLTNFAWVENWIAKIHTVLKNRNRCECWLDDAVSHHKSVAWFSLAFFFLDTIIKQNVRLLIASLIMSLGCKNGKKMRGKKHALLKKQGLICCQLLHFLRNNFLHHLQNELNAWLIGKCFSAQMAH